MGIIPKKTNKIKIGHLLELNQNHKNDQNYILFREILLGLRKIMIEKNMSKNKLARRMHISRQAVYEKFSGRNTSVKWIQRACRALGVELKVLFVEKKKAA